MSIENKSNEIWVTAFNEESAQKFRCALMEKSKEDKSAPIIIYIDSYGGQVDALAKMIETMDEVPNLLITVCVGKAMSCGAMLLSHGDMRLCGQHSRIMIHEVSSGTAGDVHDMHADVQEVKRLNEYFIGILAKNCGYKSYSDMRKLIKEQDGRDRFLTADEAVKFGIVDAVGTPNINTHVTYEVTVTPPVPIASRPKASKPKKTKKSETKKK